MLSLGLEKSFTTVYNMDTFLAIMLELMFSSYGAVKASVAVK